MGLLEQELAGRSQTIDTPLLSALCHNCQLVARPHYRAIQIIICHDSHAANPLARSNCRRLTIPGAHQHIWQGHDVLGLLGRLHQQIS